MIDVSRSLTYQVQLAGGQRRLREMVLYVSKKCASADRFGKTKLNKILWRADFDSFAERGVPVTGRAYQRLKAGPAPVEMAPVLGEMARDSLISIERNDLGNGYVEERVIALSEANLSLFSSDDIGYIDRAIARYWCQSAAKTSSDSHGVAWKTRSDGDPMPYESSLFSDSKIPLHLKGKFKDLARSRNWVSQ